MAGLNHVFPTNVVDLQTVPYSFCLIAVEISTWKTNTEQNSYTVLSCCESNLCMSGPIHGLILSHSLTSAVPGMVVSVGSEVRHLDLDLCLTTYETHDLGRDHFSGSEEFPLQNEG